MDIKQAKTRYQIIGNDPNLDRAVKTALTVADTDLSILVTGESGVGKEVFAQLIHENSSRKGKDLVKVNCGAIPKDTIESTLFGHYRGAFTGADRDTKGYFEAANNGTLFLDEIGEMPLDVQVKLLRTLENGEIMPVGASKPQKVNVRVVAATNVNILVNVRDGRFRQDLYYRLNQASISIPPLRERGDDIILLFNHFSKIYSNEYHKSTITLDRDAADFMKKYHWEGNIRELKNLVKRLFFLEQGSPKITLEVLQGYLRPISDETMPALVGNHASAEPMTEREMLYKALEALNMAGEIQQLRDEIEGLKKFIYQLIPNGTAAGTNLHPRNAMFSPAEDGQPTIIGSARTGLDSHSEEEGAYYESVEVQDEAHPAESISLQAVNRDAIIAALKRCNGNRRKSAEELGISTRTIYRKIREYGL